MKLYLSGPMTGNPNFNYDEFTRMAKILRDQGFEVLNPAENFNGEQHHPRKEYMREDIASILQADGIAVLSGWRNSKGSVFEVTMGQELGLPILDAYTLEPVKEETITEEAQRIVIGDRGPQYGKPTANFTHTAALWTAYVEGQYQFKPQDVAAFMILLKMARETHRAKRDNRVDIVGYTLTWEMVENDPSLSPH